MKLHLYCAMCRNHKDVPIATGEYESGSIRASKSISLGKLIEQAGWIYQQNGRNFDVYCSKECAA